MALASVQEWNARPTLLTSIPFAFPPHLLIPTTMHTPILHPVYAYHQKYIKSAYYYHHHWYGTRLCCVCVCGTEWGEGNYVKPRCSWMPVLSFIQQPHVYHTHTTTPTPTPPATPAHSHPASLPLTVLHKYLLLTVWLTSCWAFGGAVFWMCIGAEAPGRVVGLAGL